MRNIESEFVKMLQKVLRKLFMPWKGAMGEFSAYVALLIHGEKNVFRDLYIEPTRQLKLLK